MAVTNVAAKRGKQQFQGLYNDIWTVTYDESANIAPTTGIDAVSTVTVPGVALGDLVLAVGCSVSSNSMTITANVTAADEVKVTWANNTAGTITLTTPSVKMVIARPNF
jgi:succinyl-CoA synthetase alpha subunit